MSPHANINLHIEELVLHGFAPGDRHGISEAVQAELARLISEQPLRAGKSISQENIDGGSFRLKNNERPANIGERIAGAIHGGLPR